MHLEKLGNEKCDVGSLFKAIEKETQTKKPNAVKNTNCSEKSFKLPLPRELEKKDNEEGTLKVFSFSQIIQDPDCPTSVTIVKESLTEEAHPHDDDACSNKYKYCKEVIKPFLQPYPPGCPNSGQLLINDAVKAAAEEFPENPPCYEVPAPDKKNKQNCASSCQTPPVSKCPSNSCTDSGESDSCSPKKDAKCCSCPKKEKKDKFCESPKKEPKCCNCSKKEKKKENPCDSGPKPNFRLCPGQTEPKICIEITDPSLCPGCPKPRCGKKPEDKCCCACLIGKQDLDNPSISPQKSNNSSWPSGIESDCCDKSSESKSCIGKLLTSLKTLSDSCLKKGKSTQDKPPCCCGKPPSPPPPCPPPPCPPPPPCSCESPKPKKCPPKPCPPKPCPPKPCPPKPSPAKQCPPPPCPPPPCPPKPKPCSPKACPAKAKPCPPPPCPPKPKPCSPKPCPAKQCPPQPCPKPCPPKPCPPNPCPAKQCPSKECPAKPSSPKPCPPNPCPAKQCPSKDCPARPSPPNPCPARPCPPMQCSTSRNTMVDSPRENPSNKNKPCPHKTPDESCDKECPSNKNKPCPHETHDESCDKDCPSNKNKPCPHETHDESCDKECPSNKSKPCPHKTPDERSDKERSPNKNKPCPHEAHDESCDKECPSNKNKPCPHETHDESGDKECPSNKNKPCPHETHDESCDKDCPSNKNKPCPHETHDEGCDKERSPNKNKPCPHKTPDECSAKERSPNRYKPCPYEIPAKSSDKEHPPSRYKPCPTEKPDENSAKKSASDKKLYQKNSKTDLQSKTSSKDIHGKNGTSSGLIYSSPKGPCKVDDITSQLVQVANTNEKPHVTNTGGLCCSCGQEEKPKPKHACKNPVRTPPVCNPNSSSMLGKATMDAHNETIATLKCAMKDFMCKVFRTTQEAVSVISCESNKQYEKLKKSVSDMTSDCPPPKKVSNESGSEPSNNNLRRFSIINMTKLPETINIPPCKPPEPYPSTASGYFEAALDKVTSAASMISRSLIFDLPAQMKRSYNDDSSEYDIPNYTKPRDVDNLMNPFEVNVFTTIKDKIWSIFVDDDKQEREIRSTMSSSESLTSESDEDLINKIID